MKIARIAWNNRSITAVEVEGVWHNLSDASRRLAARPELAFAGELTIPSLLAQATGGADTLDRWISGIRGALDDGEFTLTGDFNFLLPHLPGKIIALGRNYLAHAREFGHDAPEAPIFFCKLPSACIGDGEPILIEDWYGRVDHEGEFAVVIGKHAKNVSSDAAREYIAGYTLINDVTARDIQRRDVENGHPWLRSKNFDTFCPLGPLIVLPDEVAWPVEVPIEVRVNGEVLQKNTTANFILPIPEVLAFVSRHMTLEPGDIISTGTPEGVSPLCPSDVVEIEVPQIGVLSNPVERVS